ncbi:MAG: rRNA maturation RNase YbeY [Marinilabiliales bacterium]|nr:rRNA maturation RNase YbeY [Marinilabiliales bacterium]
MAIYFNWDSVESFDIQENKIRKVIKNLLRINFLRLGEINYIFCSDEYLLEINKNFLSHDYYTDVITFDYKEGRLVSGDVYISLDTVRENGRLFGDSFEIEILRVIFHGFLHLIGYDDKDMNSKAIMTLMEDRLLEKYASLN